MINRPQMISAVPLKEIKPRGNTKYKGKRKKKKKSHVVILQTNKEYSFDIFWRFYHSSLSDK